MMTYLARIQVHEFLLVGCCSVSSVVAVSLFWFLEGARPHAFACTCSCGMLDSGGVSSNPIYYSYESCIFSPHCLQVIRLQKRSSSSKVRVVPGVVPGRLRIGTKRK